MKKMFTLRGVSECGKSTKVKAIAQWIINNYPHAINHGIDLTKRDISGVLEINKLKIGLISAGDDLPCVLGNERVLNNYPGMDILVNTCRTKGITRRYLEKNYNFSSGWLVKNIFVQKFNPANSLKESSRDNLILDELKCWLTGLEKL